MAMSNGGFIPQSMDKAARVAAAQRMAQQSEVGKEQRQQEAGQAASSGANILGTLAGAIAGGIMGGPPGAMAGASLGGAIGGIAGKGTQMVIDPNARTPQNVLGMAQGAVGAIGGGDSFIDKYGRKIPMSAMPGSSMTAGAMPTGMRTGIGGPAIGR